MFSFKKFIKEISKQKLTDYILDARDDHEAAERQARHSYSQFRNKSQTPEKRKEFWDEYTWLSNKKKNREKGIKLALKKIDESDETIARMNFRRERAKYHLNMGKSEKDAWRFAQSETNKKFPKINTPLKDNPYYKAKQGIT